MAARAGLFVVLILIAPPLAREWPRELIVWNVGQGQWATLADEATCWHFDAGGEFAPWAALARRCGERLNGVVFSHWDADHVSFASRLAQTLANACLARAPVGAANARKRRLLARLPACRVQPSFASWVDDHARDSNGRSRVSLIADVLMPGDAPAASERRFTAAFLGLARVRWLVLGHHGSRTSTSRVLLERLSGLRGAIASARRARYGHPHAETLERLRAARVPTLLTEDWGNVHVEL